MLGTELGLKTAIHEFTHPALVALKKVNPEMFGRMMELAPQLPGFQELKASEEYGHLAENEIEMEAWCRLMEGWGSEKFRSQVPAKIYEEVNELVKRFAAQFGENVLGIRNFTPAMMAGWTINDYLDAVGGEMMSGRKFGADAALTAADAAKGFLASVEGGGELDRLDVIGAPPVKVKPVKPVKLGGAKDACEVLKKIVGTKDVRQELRYVHVEAGTMVATSRRSLLAAPAPKGLKDGDYLNGVPENGVAFPDWRAVFPDTKNFQRMVVANGGTELGAINFADQLGVKGKLYAKGGHGVSVEIGGQRYSARYLKDMLEAMYKLGAEKVELYTEKEIGKFVRPMVLKAKSERGELIGALMPIRNGNEHDTRIDLKASQPRFAIGGLTSGNEWVSRNAEERLAQGWTFNPKGLTKEELRALAAVVPERHHTSMQSGSRAERNDTILEAMYPPNYADTYWPQFVKQFGGNKEALARIRKALYLIYGGDTNNKARWLKLDAPQFENIPKMDKAAADKRNAEFYKQEQEVYKARQARNKELGYPAYKDDPEWQRLDAEYNRIRQERLSPSAEQTARFNAMAEQRAARAATQDERFEQYRAERIAQGEAELARVAKEYGVEYKTEDGQIRFSMATRVYNPDARVKIVDGRKEPAFINLTTAELRHYLQDKYQGKEVEITSDNTIVLFTGEGLKSALKKRDTHKRTLHVLDELVRDSHYTRYEPNDGQAKHKSVNGQFVYTTALRLSDGVYGVELKLDLPKSDPDKTYFKGQTVKMKIADAVLSAGPRSVEPLPANTSGASAAETIRLGDIVSTPTSISYSGAKSQAESFKFSRPITPAEDTAYMDAVKRGDMETAGRMVREAATREMPNTKVVGDDREPLKVYHATDNDFTVFDKRRLGEFTDKNAVDDAAKQLARLGFWFNEKDLHKQIWAKKAVGAYLNITNPYDTSLDELWRELREQKAESFVSDLKAWGYDGIVLDDSEFGGKSFVAFEPNQIKFADPVTYDDAGNVISLSQRFNDRNADLRFARAGEGERKSRFVAGKVRVITPPEGMGEQEPGILAASVELANRETPPAMAARRARKLSLSMSELEWLRKKLTGDLGDQVVGKKSSARAKGLALNADVFGLVDRTDMEQLKRELKAAGYFRNEEAAFCQAASKEGVRAERERSEAALADRLNALAESRVKGEAAGGQAAARGIFADMLGKVITHLPLDGMPVNLKSLRSLGDALKAATKDQAFKLEAMGAMPERASALEPEPTDSEICARMVATYLISPESMEHAAPKWFGAIEDVLLRNDKLRGAMEELLAGAEEGRGAGAIALEKIRREQRGEVERIQRELFAEINEPIQRPGVMKQLQEKVLVAFHDKMAPVILRVDDRAKLYLKAAKEALKAAKTPAEVRAARDELDRFTQGLLSAKKRLMLARGAWERGAWNDDSRYLYKMLELENDATERWGLDDGEISNFMFLERTVELGGRAVSHGLTVRDAQRELDRLKAETPEKYARLDEYAQKFHAIVEQEVIDNPAMRRMFGDQFMDFLKTQTHYVTMRRTLNAEQLEWYRERLKEAGVQATDDIYDKLERWTNRRGGQGADGGDFTATLAGSMSAKAEVRGATMEKHLRAFRSVRKNDYVLAMKDLLVENGVEGVKVLPRGALFLDANGGGTIGHLGGDGFGSFGPVVGFRKAVAWGRR